ncbi:MAG TPA: hypothetical protein VJA16_16075 [Thermoanaerobaculia bacterium]
MLKSSAGLTLSAALMFVSWPTSLGAQNTGAQQAALKLITDTAKSLCADVSVELQDNKVELTGAAAAKLDGIVKKIVNLGVEGAAKYQTGSSKGVLRQDLAVAIKHSDDCRLSVFNALVPRMLPAAIHLPPPQPGPSPVAEFTTPKGSFRKEGDRWVEYPPYGPEQYFIFREQARDADYVYLVDPSRQKPGSQNNAMLVRLPLHGGAAQWSYQNPIQWSDFTIVHPVGK